MRRTPTRGSIALLAFMAACSGSGAEFTNQAFSAQADQSVFDLAVGRWDWSHGDSTCLGNQHEISFSEDGSEMLLTFDRPLNDSSEDPVVRYRITGSGERIHENLRFVIRAEMDGESRTTDSGELVVWDLIMATPNRYHWHRTDWPQLGVTNAVVRCDGARPVEGWVPPSRGPGDPGATPATDVA